MIQIKHFISALLFCSSLSLSAMDKNDTVAIINEASKATEGLQEEFSELIETKEPIQQIALSTTTDHNVTAQEVIVVEENSISENNITTPPLETNSTLEENQTVEQDTTTEEEEGSFTKGMVIFKTKFKAICKMTGEEFAKNYTQEDWDDIYDNDEFEKVVYELCPEMKGKYKKKWTKDLYQFSLKYASDSDEIPEC